MHYGFEMVILQGGGKLQYTEYNHGLVKEVNTKCPYIYAQMCIYVCIFMCVYIISYIINNQKKPWKDRHQNVFFRKVGVRIIFFPPKPLF